MLSPSCFWRRWVRPVLPSFIADALLPNPNDSHPVGSTRSRRPTRSTAYLDGLRGIAAMLVFIHHYTGAFPSLFLPYTLLDPPSNQTNAAARPKHQHPLAGVVLPTHANSNTTVSSSLLPAPSIKYPKPTFLQLPFIRVLFSGRPMVHIFFVISGFALSYKTFRCLYHDHNRHKALDSLASTTFRRAPRLLVPPIISTFFIAILQQAGLLETPNNSVLAELRGWSKTVFREITWPWAWDRDMAPGYDIHLWTIPIELAHSMMLFVVLLALARVRYIVRNVIVGAGMGYCLACGRWAAFEFLVGMALAETHVRREVEEEEKGLAMVEECQDELGDVDRTGPHAAMNRVKAVNGIKTFSRRTVRLIRALGHWGMRLLQVTALVACLFITGWPTFEESRSPIIRTLISWTPEPFATELGDVEGPQKFWFALAAAGVVWAVGELSWVRRLFETSVAQYCGDISFAMYICHGAVSDLLGDPIMGYPTKEDGSRGRGVQGVLGMETPRQIVVGWIIGLFLLSPFVIWAADVFWRAVDRPVVNLARKFEIWCLEEERRTRTAPESEGYSVLA
ncbi:hypothetical protein VTJ04DRAFT_10833 [Mycothermus thermophilus]|uniref:uncharacterized protein n=1 Tax=Humicola insolens TaxID=85995 RepID=UPI0037424FF0